MLELHHAPISSCSQKVRLILAAKGLDFVSHEVDLLAGGQHDPAYVKLNPNHVVPTLVDDGQALIESTLINEYLDDAYPEPPMRPKGAVARHAARLWTTRLDALQASVAVVTYAIGPRMILMNQPKAVRDANIEAIPDPVARERRRSVLEHGIAAPEFKDAIANLIRTLDEMDAALANGRWLSGEAFGLADAAALPFVLRMDHCAMTPLITQRQRVADWLGRLQAMPAYETAVAAWLPEPIVALFQNNGAALWSEIEAALEA